MQQKKEVDPNRKGKIWIGIFMAALMILSLAGIIASDNGPSNQFEYNDIQFTPRQNFFTADIGDKERIFYFFPTDTFPVETYPELRNDLVNSQVYIVTFDPSTDPNSLIYMDPIRFDFDKSTDKQVYQAMTGPSDIYFLPEISCLNSSLSQRVIFLNTSNETSITKSGECIVLNGQGSELLRVRDALLYRDLGVIDG